MTLSTGSSTAVTAGVPAARVDPATLPGYENRGKPGYYTVQPGDTVMKVSRDFHQNWRDIVSWNNLSDPNAIEVGQVLRVSPPGGGTIRTAKTQPAAQPVKTVSAAPVTAKADAATPGRFIWPTSGAVLTGFDNAKNKGLDIGGKAGDPVVASADGKVVYAGSGLRGYGNLVILKHDSTFLTVYAHNQSLLVKEDQTVRQGQKIATMGNTDADRVKLHFEVRKSGTPVDPKPYLPAR